MELDSNLVIRLTHDTIKPIRSMVQRLEMMDQRPGAMKDDESARRMWRAYLSSVGKALEDLQALASADLSTAEYWSTVEWKALLETHQAALVKAGAGSFVFKNLAEPTEGEGDEPLFQLALGNMVWFATHFGNRLISVAAEISAAHGRKTLELSYRMETQIPLTSDFEKLEPFYAMSQQSLALPENSGLLLFAVKRILERHGGTLKAKAQQIPLVLDWSLPLAPEKRL